MTSRTLSSGAIDGAAISLSGLCIIHCLALPLFAASLPMIGALAEAEWVHGAFVLLAIPLSGYAISRALAGGRQFGFITLAMLGLGLLLAGAFVEALHDYETLLTVSGGLVLALAHLSRWLGHQPS